MIVEKASTTAQEDEIFNFYELVDAKDADNVTVKIKKLVSSERKSNLVNQVASLTKSLTTVNSKIAEIEKLE